MTAVTSVQSGKATSTARPSSDTGPWTKWDECGEPGGASQCVCTFIFGATQRQAQLRSTPRSWFRLQHEAHDAAQAANSSRSEDDLFFDVIECTSDACERRRTPRKPSDAYWYSA